MTDTTQPATALTDFQKSVLIALVSSRLSGDGPHYLTYDDLAQQLGSAAQPVAGALTAVGNWLRAHALPDLGSIVISSENAAKHVMLPADEALSSYGGEAGARAEADRVRDFDWQGWLDA